LSLLIGGILAALRQVFHLSSCPNLPGHLFPRSGTVGSEVAKKHVFQIHSRL
jgi:hypothetical protein